MTKRDLGAFMNDWEGLQSLVRETVREGLDLDYKREEYGSSRKSPERRSSDREELRRDVTSIANAGGGWIVIGIDETPDGDPSSVCGIDDLAANETRTRDLLSDRIHPALGSCLIVRSVKRPGSGSEGVIVISVGAAAQHRPFAVENEYGLLEFWTRFDRKKKPIGYQALAETFTPSSEELQEHQLAANARSEIRKIAYQITVAHPRWPRRAELLRELKPYAQHSDLMVKRDIAEAVYDVVDSARGGIPPSLARDAVALLEEALPYYSLRHRHPRRPSDEECELLTATVEFVWPLVYDGIRYLGDLAVAWAGMELWADLLRYARLNDLSVLQDRLREFLAQAQETAQRSQMPEAERLLRHVDAYGNDIDVELPTGLEWVVRGQDRPDP